MIIKNKYKKINSSMAEIKSSIIEKEKLIYLSNLFDDLSKSTSVRIDLFAPINKIKEESICKISEVNQISKNLLLKEIILNQIKKILPKPYTSLSFSGII